MKRARTQSDRGGFTLTEATVAIIFIGLGMAGMLTSLSSGTRATESSYKLTRAGLLIREIREHTFAIPFDDLLTQTYSECIDGNGDAMDFEDQSHWSQTITVSRRLNNDLETVDTADSSNVKYVQANILYDGQSILQAGWLVTGEVAP
ncbi:MAG: hypothetical protein HN350_04515 [Phycisphaerales bacterium]|jgi:type II secretory pathway pseudopilin PulG|nr:hypothetical protein [Phycisphaerales bacterium]